VFKNILKNRNLLSIVITFFIFLFVFSLSGLDVLTILNKKVNSLYFYKPKPVSNNILLIEIDEDTVAWRKLPNGVITKKWLWRFPFDRKYFAEVINKLKDAWATVIALDVIFWEESNPESDKLLSDAIKNAWNVVLWVWPEWQDVRYPYPMFWDNALAEWYFSVNLNDVTDTVYSIRPFAKFKNSVELFNHFSLAILRWFYAKIYEDNSYLTNDFVFTKDKITLNDRIKMLRSWTNKNEVLINYAETYRFYKKSFLDVYNWEFNKNDVKDKIVIIWATAEWIKDVFQTPIWPLYWVYLHANLINTIITNNWIVYINIYLEWLLLFMLVIISVYFNISRSSYVLLFSNIAIVWLLIWFIYYITWYTNFVFSIFVEFFIALFWSLIVSNVIKYYIENVNKTKLNKALSEYVSEDVAREILSWEWLINLNWENKVITIFFSDIEWFTTISEKMTPEELVAFLREYLTEMTDVIIEENWFINKYEWDAVMALWWVFWKDWIETFRACSAAIKQHQVLTKLNLKWNKRPFLDIKVRIWIHEGSAIIWNIWAEWKKMEFTALWDSVNLASRLEWVNKYYGTYICVSETIYEKERENFEFRYLDKIRVKWKQQPIKIYELINFKWDLREDQKEMLFSYRIASNLYLNWEFSESLIHFNNIVKKWWDKPSMTFKERCEFYIKNPPGKDWDGVWTMKDK